MYAVFMNAITRGFFREKLVTRVERVAAFYKKKVLLELYKDASYPRNIRVQALRRVER